MQHFTSVTAIILHAQNNDGFLVKKTPSQSNANTKSSEYAIEPIQNYLFHPRISKNLSTYFFLIPLFIATELRWFPMVPTLVT